jgi:putative heme-binding domain-containing protein
MARLRAAEVLALGRLPPAGLTGLIEAARADPLIAPTLVLGAAERSGLTDVTAGPLLEYLVASVERGWPLTETQLAWVLEGAPESAQLQARKLEAALRDQETHRRAVLEDYRPLLTTGNPERGRSLFFEQAGCHACHQVAGQGRAVGPDLTKIGAIRSGNDLLESVLFPSATMAQGFEAYEVELADGESMLGTLARQTPDQILMRNSSGAELRLPRDQILSLTRSKLSMMPEGLLQALTRDEAADVLAYLRSLK